MNTPPVNRLPVDPSPKATSSETADRRFADLLEEKRGSARTEEQRPTTAAEPRERQAEPNARNENDAPVHTKNETPDRNPETGADQTEQVDAGNSEDEGDGHVVTLPGFDAAESAVTPVPSPSASIPTAPPSTQPLPAITGESGAETMPDGTAVVETTTGPVMETTDAPGADNAIDTTGSAVVDPANVDTEANGPQSDSTKQSVLPAQTPQSDIPAQPIVATGQPAPAIEQGAASASAQPIVAKAVSGIRNGGPITGPAQDGAPTAAGQPNGEPAENAQKGEFGPATARTPGATAPGTASENTTGATTGSNAAPTTDSAAAAARAASPPLDAASAANDPSANRIGELPAQSTTGSSPNHQTASSATFGSELRVITDGAVTGETAAPRTQPNPAANQVAVQINRAVQDGQEKFTVNLKPGTLGKITVNLELGHDQRVIAVISADRPDTLDLLQRDARTLERALQDAGLKTDSGSLSFNLQGEGTGNGSSDDDLNPGQLAALNLGDDGDEPVAADTNPYAHVANASGIDIHV